MLANVKIEQDKENECIHRVFVDGKPIEKAIHLDFQIEPLEIPIVTVELMSGVDFEGRADLNFLENPFTIQKACEILREELLKHGDLYKAFSASIYSALKDIPDETWIDEIPEIVLSRMIGED